MVPACVRVAEGNNELAGRVALTGHLGLDDIRSACGDTDRNEDE